MVFLDKQSINTTIIHTKNQNCFLYIQINSELSFVHFLDSSFLKGVVVRAAPSRCWNAFMFRSGQTSVATPRYFDVTVTVAIAERPSAAPIAIATDTNWLPNSVVTTNRRLKPSSVVKDIELIIALRKPSIHHQETQQSKRRYKHFRLRSKIYTTMY